MWPLATRAREKSAKGLALIVISARSPTRHIFPPAGKRASGSAHNKDLLTETYPVSVKHLQLIPFGRLRFDCLPFISSKLLTHGVKKSRHSRRSLKIDNFET